MAEEKDKKIAEGQALSIVNEEADEHQVKGMKDMFTALLVENRKEYDRQVTDMKQLFLSVIEDNRRTFDTKVQELYSDLPRIVERTISNKVPSEDFIYLQGQEDSQMPASRDQVDKFTRLQAVTEIILGDNVRDLEGDIKAAQSRMHRNLDEDKNRISQIATEISEALQAASERINDSLNSLYDDLQSHFDKHDQKQAHHKLFSAYMGELSDKVKE